MKNNAIVRIVLWSLVIVLLLGVLLAGLGGYFFRLPSRNPDTRTPLLMEAITSPTFPISDDSDGSTARANVTVNVRKSPSPTSESIGTIEAGEAVQILSTETVNGTQWCLIGAPLSGWVDMEHIDVGTIQEDPITVTDPTSADMVNVRKSPDHTSEVVGMVEAGKPVQILRTEEVNGTQWGLIDTPVSGWVVTDYVEVDEIGSGTNAAGNNASASKHDGAVSVAANEVKEISIDWVNGNISIEPADVKEITFWEEGEATSKYTMVYKCRGGKLTIAFSENTVSFSNNILNIGLGNFQKDLTIQVPQDFSLRELELDAANADLEVNGLIIDEVDIDTASSTATFLSCQVGEMDVDSASGDVFFKGSLEKLDFDSASADFTGEFENVPSQLIVDAMSCTLDITLPSDAGFTAKLDGMSNDFSSDFETTKQNGSYVHGNGACRIELDGMSNTVTISKSTASVPAPSAPSSPTAPTAPTAPAAAEATTAPTTKP